VPVQVPDRSRKGRRILSNRTWTTGAALFLPATGLGLILVSLGIMNPGQALTWIGFFAALVAAIAFLAASGGREGALPWARGAFVLLWVALALSTFTLWRILFNHDFNYQYAAQYSSSSMPSHYVFAAFWGGQEGTFVLWALMTATLGLVMMRVRHALTTPAMFFVTLPLVMLMLVTVMRGPFLMFPPGQAPPDGQGLNPLLQDPWMTIHPPVLFLGFSSLVAPFAVAMAAMVRRDYDGWIKPGLPWVVFSTSILATGFIMGGVWAYKVLGWGGYWGWDPVENGSLIPWLSNIALLHGLLVQRVTGSLRRTNFFLAVTSYVLVLYASFLTRSGVLADFSVHSFVNLGLNGFLLSFLFLTMGVGYGTWLYRLRDMPGAPQPLGNFSRESMMWLGQLVFMLMCALVAIGMSAPLITRLFGPASNVQIEYYNLVNGPLAIAMGLLLGLAPLMRWRHQDPQALMKAALPGILIAVMLTLVAMISGVREPIPALIVFGASFALVSNAVVTARGFRAGWKHGVPYLAHLGAAILLIGIIASSGYGTSIQLQLPRGQERTALGYQMTFAGMTQDGEGKDHVLIAVDGPQRKFKALPAMYWSEFNQGYMKKPHIERFLMYDVYISPLEMIGGADPGESAVWFAKGETKQVGQAKYTFVDFDVSGMNSGEPTIAAQVRVETGGRTVPVQPKLKLSGGQQQSMPAYMPGGGSVSIVSVDAQNGRVGLELPGTAQPRQGEVLAIEVSTKPLINLVWLGAIVMLLAGFLSTVRRALDLKRERRAAVQAGS